MGYRLKSHLVSFWLMPLGASSWQSLYADGMQGLAKCFVARLDPQGIN
jgi:hypothetical protein